MIFPESACAHYFLDGLSGIEIGGSAHNPFNIRGCRNVDYTAEMTIAQEEQMRLAGTRLAVDIVAPGDKLPLADESLDFVLNSHVIEHFWDPIAAIKEWLRVLRPGGIVFMVVPHKERTFDAEKPRTPLVDLIARHNGELEMSSDVDPHGHHSIWITQDVVELINYLELETLYALDKDDKVGNGFIVVFRKAGKLITPPGPALDLGCGSRKRNGTLGIDKRPGPGVDIVLDLMSARLPFQNNSIPSITSNGLFQFLDDPGPLLREIVRVCQPGATVDIWTPHGASDGSMSLGARQRYAELTWIEILGSEIFNGTAGNLTLNEILLLVAPQTLEALKQTTITLDYAIRHNANVVSRIGAVMTVNKPHAPPTTNYSQRVLQDPG